MSYLLGIDVSAYQGSDISGLLTGRDFCIVKATQGAHTVDDGWTSRLNQARTAGVVVGVYHYAMTDQDVNGDIDHFVDTFAPHAEAGDLIFVDVEMTGGHSASYVTAWKDTWIGAVQEAFPEHLVGLYCNTNYWLHETTSNFGDALWIASYGTSDPGIQADWTIWQYTSSPVDTNKAKFDSRSEMQAWALSKSTTDPDDGGDDGGSDGTDDDDTDAFPGTGYFGPGQSNEYVTRLGQMLIERGGAPFYATGAGPTWTDVDGAAMAAFQTAQGWSGADANGIPGPQSWNMLVDGTGNDIYGGGGYLPFPSSRWFEDAPNCWIITEMGQRLVDEGCDEYSSGPSAQWTSSDKASYALWQEHLGYSGSAADGIPGRMSWDALNVPAGG